MPTLAGDDVAKALNRIARVLAVLLVEQGGDATQREKIRVLRLCGFGPKETAEILGTTRNTVNVALANLKGKGAKKG
jgi:DNA-binding CsgD family transcriptional regulator